MEIPPYLPYFQKFKCPLCKEKIALWHISNSREFNCPSCDALLVSNYREASKKAYFLGVPVFLVILLFELFVVVGHLTWLKVLVAFGGLISFYIGYLIFLKNFKIHKA